MYHLSKHMPYLYTAISRETDKLCDKLSEPDEPDMTFRSSGLYQNTHTATPMLQNIHCISHTYFIIHTCMHTLKGVCSVCTLYTGTPRTEAYSAPTQTGLALIVPNSLSTFNFQQSGFTTSSSLPWLSPSPHILCCHCSAHHAVPCCLGPSGSSFKAPGLYSLGASFRDHRCRDGAC